MSLRLILAFALSICAFSLGTFIMKSHRLVIPLAQWSWALPAVFVGLAIGLISQMENRKKRIVTSVVLVVLVAGMCYLSETQETGFLLPYTISVIATAGCFLWSSRSEPTRITQSLVTLTLGIYLVHPLVSSLVSYILWFEMPAMAKPVVVFAISAITILTMKKTLLKVVV